MEHHREKKGSLASLSSAADNWVLWRPSASSVVVLMLLLFGLQRGLAWRRVLSSRSATICRDSASACCSLLTGELVSRSTVALQHLFVGLVTEKVLIPSVNSSSQNFSHLWGLSPFWVDVKQGESKWKEFRSTFSSLLSCAAFSCFCLNSWELSKLTWRNCKSRCCFT